MSGFFLSPIPLARIVLRLVEPILPGLSVAASDTLNARRKAKRDAVEAAAAADSPVATKPSAAVTGENQSTTDAVTEAAPANKRQKNKSKKKGKGASGKPSVDDGQPGAKLPKKQ
jgi:hypothetical protein